MIERSIRRPPVGRFGAIHYGLLRHLLAQVTPDPNRPLTGKRIRNDSLSNMVLRLFAIAPKQPQNLVESASLIARKETSTAFLIYHHNRETMLINVYGNFVTI